MDGQAAHFAFTAEYSSDFRHVAGTSNDGPALLFRPSPQTAAMVQLTSCRSGEVVVIHLVNVEIPNVKRVNIGRLSDERLNIE